MIKSITGINPSIIRQLNNCVYSDLVAYGITIIPEPHANLLRAMLVSGYDHGISFLDQKIYLGRTYNDLTPELENMTSEEYIYIKIEKELVPLD